MKSRSDLGFRTGCYRHIRRHPPFFKRMKDRKLMREQRSRFSGKIVFKQRDEIAIRSRLSDWLLSAYTEASSVFQEDERPQTDAGAKKPIFRKDRVQTKG